MEFFVSVDKKTAQRLSILFRIVVIVLFFGLSALGNFIYSIGIDFDFLIPLLAFIIIGGAWVWKVRLLFDGDKLVLTGLIPYPKVVIKLSDIERSWTKETNLSDSISLLDIFRNRNKASRDKKTIFIKLYTTKNNEFIQIKGRGQGTTDSIISYLSSYGINVEQGKLRKSRLSRDTQ